MSADRIIREYWEAMATNDFAHASTHLSEDFQFYMPQSGEYFEGREIFATLNTRYPAQGRWQFEIVDIVAQDASGVSDVLVTDGQTEASAITFHWIRNGLIWRQREFWPDPYPAPEWRTDLTEVRSTAPF